jgi:O-methyltransferase involved in polyketide biosynthesis
VMMYLDLAAIDTVFAYVASLPSPSEIAFSYARPGRLFAAEAPIAAAAAAVGEPWKSRFSAKELEARLRAHGFADVDFLDARTANARYHPIRAGLPPMMRVSIGAARLSAPAAPA